RIAKQLLQQRLAACVHVHSMGTSLYEWQGQLQQRQECSMVCKTNQHCVARLIRLIKQLHSDDTPEILVLPVIDGDADYCRWLQQTTAARVQP
ncbi:MAG: divalent-cation tolerance protein CutA, partial [Myxococcota bacterium]